MNLNATKTFALMRAAAAAIFAPLALQQALAGIAGQYRSRGKGRAGYQNSRHTVAQDKRAALKARNRARQK